MIIITGASGGIGKYLLMKYLNNNIEVVGLYNSTVPDNNYLDHYFKVDITNIKDIDIFIESIKDKLSNIVLVNCAGTNYNKFAHKADLIKWSYVINVNLIGTFNMIHRVLGKMRKDNYGRIINLSSIVAQTPTPGASAYAASKAALWGLTRSIAVENGEKNITINNLNLGYFNTGIINEVPSEYLKQIIEKIPTGQLGDPKVVYDAVEFLINNEYINGTSIDINAGLF